MNSDNQCWEGGGCAPRRRVETAGRAVLWPSRSPQTQLLSAVAAQRRCTPPPAAPSSPAPQRFGPADHQIIKMNTKDKH